MLKRLAKRVIQSSPDSVQRVAWRARLLARLARADLPFLEQFDWLWRGFSLDVPWPKAQVEAEPFDPDNALRTYFETHREGPGIWKWLHYFDVYDRHFKKFRGREVHILEIGIYSGGSLPMWREYFGPGCHVYGVDIEEACLAYQGDGIDVFIGDQADRDFWKRFREKVPHVDIVVDDGGHRAEQQAVTLEELLPHVAPGGVFLCEDIHGSLNHFSSYVSGLVHQLNSFQIPVAAPDEKGQRRRSPVGGLQGAVASIHSYPFVTVIEKRDAPIGALLDDKHGTRWQPFFENEPEAAAGTGC